LERFPYLAIAREHLAVILFVVAIVGIAFGVLVALFLLFRNERQGRRLFQGAEFPH
jgi:hypothetical protein